MDKKLPTITLILSVLFLALAITALVVGSYNSRTYNQMIKAPILKTRSEIPKYKDSGFLITGLLKSDPSLNEPLTIELPDGDVILKPGFVLSRDADSIFKTGSQITIYAVIESIKEMDKLKGYELYLGTPNQYINYHSSPYNSYMTYVRIFIGLALIFFLFSLLINIKK